MHVFYVIFKGFVDICLVSKRESLLLNREKATEDINTNILLFVFNDKFNDKYLHELTKLK